MDSRKTTTRFTLKHNLSVFGAMNMNIQEIAVLGVVSLVCLMLTTNEFGRFPVHQDETQVETHYHSSGVTYLSPDDPRAEVPSFGISTGNKAPL